MSGMRAAVICAAALLLQGCGTARAAAPHTPKILEPDPHNYVVVDGDTVPVSFLPADEELRSGSLTEKDFREVAAELGVEVAAIKAVVDIEAGRTHQGFWTEGKPLINFDLGVYRSRAAKRGVDLRKAARTHPVIFSRPNTARYGSQQAGQQARLDAAMALDSISAIEGTFWGMFQIGGFNWKRCGARSHSDFVRLMSRSERDQLELFATFIRNAGLLPALQKKDWRTFARGYNGPSDASRSYHTRLASSYAKHKRS